MSTRKHRTHRRAGRRSQRGQSLTEFAIVAPLLLLLAFGVFDFGRGMSANVTVTNGSREGARYLAVNAVAKGASSNYGDSCYGTGATPAAPASDSAQGKAWRQLQNAGLTLTQVTMTVKFYIAANDPSTAAASMTITCSGGSVVTVNPSGTYVPASGDWLSFDVAYQYSPSTPLIGNIVSSISMDRPTIMVLE